MLSQAHVGSFDAWLPSVASPQACPVDSSRPKSPFAAVANATHSHSEPVAIPRSTGLNRPGRPGLLTEPVMDTQRLGGTKIQSPLKAHNSSHRFASMSDDLCQSDDLYFGSVVSVPEDNLQHSCGDMEGTMRHGRRKLATSSPSCQGLAGGQGILTGLGNASSLPAVATQAAISLTSLCTALSTPACTASLASDQGRGKANCCSTSEMAACAAAATAAFARSITWDPSLLPSSYDDDDSVALLPSSASCPIAFTCRAGSSSPAAAEAEADQKAQQGLPSLEEEEEEEEEEGKEQQRQGFLAVARPVAAACATIAAFSATGAPDLRCLLAIAEEAVGAAPTAMAACGFRPGLSTRRGLYEGTVRGGVPRNTWLNCKVPEGVKQPAVMISTEVC